MTFGHKYHLMPFALFHFSNMVFLNKRGVFGCKRKGYFDLASFGLYQKRTSKLIFGLYLIYFQHLTHSFKDVCRLFYEAFGLIVGKEIFSKKGTFFRKFPVG